MTRIIVHLFAVFLYLISYASATIQIFNPDSLKRLAGNETGFVENGMANFGHIDYGSSIVSLVLTLIFANLCSFYRSVKYSFQ